VEGYTHPLPAGLTSIGGFLCVRGYTHPLPAGLTSIGGSLDVEGYTHPLPAGLTSIGRSLYVRGYTHPLPAGLKVNGAEIPVLQDIDAKILAAVGPNAEHLDMKRWHCGTSHCRAGWAITLCGKAGKKLEMATSSEMAGALIYAASRPGIPIPDFRASESAALADMQRCAALYGKNSITA
jgi:hypothetical protein